MQALLAEKTKHQAILVEALAIMYKKHNSKAEAVSKRIFDISEALSSYPLQNTVVDFEFLRSREARASKLFFSYVKAILPASYAFKARKMPHSSDLFNASLNYLYGILYSHVQGALIHAGLDPFLGIMHRDDYNKPSLVFDVIEKYRHWADYVLLHLCHQEILSPHEQTHTDSILLLSESTRRILSASLIDYLNEVIEYEGLERSRLTHIQLFAHELANQIKDFKL